MAHDLFVNEETGKYIRTLCLLHQHGGSLPKEKIEKVVGSLTEPIMEKLDVDPKGWLFNKRLTDESNKRSSFCDSRRSNVLKRYKSSTYVEHMKVHMENENEDKDLIDYNIIKSNKIKYLDYVHMTKEQYQKLVDEYGEKAAKRMIEILDNYKGAKGKKYKDDYRAIAFQSSG